MTITATEFKTNLGEYINFITNTGENITVTKNGKKVLQVSKPQLSGTDKLASLLKTSSRKWDYEDLKKSAMEEKYDIAL